MPDTQQPKKKPAWLTGEQAEPPEPTLNPERWSHGPRAEDDTSELIAAVNRDDAHQGSPEVSTATIPRVTPSTVPKGPNVGGDGGARSEGNSPGELLQKLRANPAPALLAVLVLLVLAGFFWFMFLRGWGEADKASGTNDGQRASLAAKSASAAGGVDDTGIIFNRLDEGGGDGALQGAGLSWDGSVTKKDGAAGESITLTGPTAAQVERGFEVDNSDIDSGVYALAQDDGSVLHVDTHTYQLVKAQEDSEADEQIQREITLGTIFNLQNGDLNQLGFYIDRPAPDSPKITRTYYPGPDFDPKESYRVSFNAPKGTPVPLLVGYRNNGQKNQQSN